MRFSTIILAYFVVGAVMFGGGAIDYEEAGVATFFVEEDGGTFGPDEETAGELEGLGGAIQQLLGEFIGAIQLVYNLIVSLLGFLNWPLVVLSSANAPPMAVLLLGGTFTAAFYMSVIRLIQSSA
jgi:hypothetical protein